MPPKNENKNETEVMRILEENTVLVRENNLILRRLRRNSVIDLWLRVVWYAILIGLPFVLYFYILAPYFDVLGISSEKIRLGIGQLPGVKIFQSMFGK